MSEQPNDPAKIIAGTIGFAIYGTAILGLLIGGWTIYPAIILALGLLASARTFATG